MSKTRIGIVAGVGLFTVGAYRLAKSVYIQNKLFDDYNVNHNNQPLVISDEEDVRMIDPDSRNYYDLTADYQKTIKSTK